MTTPATPVEVSCPYGCGNRRVFDPGRRFCNQCGGWLNYCPAEACRTPNRIFARFCRACRAAVDPWESWPCYSGDPCASGRSRRAAPWKDLSGVRLLSPWTRSTLNLGAEVRPPAAVAAFGALMAFTAEGNLVMADLRDGAEIDRARLSEDPVALHVTGERLLVISAERARLFSIVGRSGENYSSPVPSGFRRVWERPVPAAMSRWVGQPVPCGPHFAVASAGRDAFAVSLLRLDTHDDAWESDPKTFPGEFAFLLPWGEAGVVVGNRDGLVVGLTGIRGLESFRLTLPSGLSESFPTACIDEGRLFWFNAGGDLSQLELSGRKTAKAVGAAHVERPSMLGVSPRDLVAGDRQGTVWRYNAYGLEATTYSLASRIDETRVGFTLPPLLTEDGCLMAAAESGTILFFGPRSSAAPLERSMTFKTGSHLRSFLLVGSVLVGINTLGEVQALKILPEEEASQNP